MQLEDNITQARMLAGSALPEGAELFGVVRRENGQRGALMRLASGNLVQFNAGVIRSLDTRALIGAILAAANALRPAQG